VVAAAEERYRPQVSISPESGEGDGRRAADRGIRDLLLPRRRGLDMEADFGRPMVFLAISTVRSYYLVLIILTTSHKRSKFATP
jgi:hypothetical protein